MRRTKDQPIKTPADRRALKAVPGKDYWVEIEVGLAVGWCANKTTVGSWLLRLTTPWGKQLRYVIGKADDKPGASGTMTFREAWKKAELDGGRLKTGFEVRGSRLVTVADAVDLYGQDKWRRGQAGQRQAVYTFQKHYLGDLGRVLLRTLRAPHLSDWQAEMANKEPVRRFKNHRTTLSASNTSKYRGILAAALRHSRVVPEDTIKWGLKDQGLQEMKPTGRPPLSTEQVLAFIKSAYQQDEDIGAFVLTFAITGCRPSQLARCKKTDLGPDYLMVPPSRKGKRGGEGKDYAYVPILPEIADRLRQLPAGPDGLLLSYQQKAPRRGTWRLFQGPGWKGQRLPWQHTAWNAHMQDIIKRAGLPPGTVLYSLRSSRIQQLLADDNSIQAVSSMLDTSSTMIQSSYTRKYGHRPDLHDRIRASQQVGVLALGDRPKTTPGSSPRF
jgi:hypothetical protein